MAPKKSSPEVKTGVIATNRQARSKFEILDKWEAGIVLTGTEVKAARTGSVQLKDGFAIERDGELYLLNVHIPPYGPAARENHEPERTRKLLLKRYELERLRGKTKERGVTLVPLSMYFKGPNAKVEIALAKGKSKVDKRQDLKKRDQEAEMRRAMAYRPR